ncbi:hypothetical protein ACVWU4_000938 [Campylobacter coli]
MKIFNHATVGTNDPKIMRVYKWLFHVNEEFTEYGIEKRGTAKLIVPKYYQRVFKDMNKILSLKGGEIENYIKSFYPEAYYKSWI